MSGGQFNIPITFRGPNGPAHQLGAPIPRDGTRFMYNAARIENLHTGHAARRERIAEKAVRDNNPVLVLEAELLYSSKDANRRTKSCSFLLAKRKEARRPTFR